MVKVGSPKPHWKVTAQTQMLGQLGRFDHHYFGIGSDSDKNM